MTSIPYDRSSYNLDGDSGGNLEAALDYADSGTPVFPCKPDKSPRTTNGFYDATTDAEQIRKWWAKHPHDLIGVPTGGVSGVFVLDEDNGEVGAATVARIEAENGKLPRTYTTGTPGDPAKDKQPGKQRYFKYPETGAKSSVSKLGTNLDVRGDGGYVIVPPSAGYYVADGADIAEAPQWLVELVRPDATEQARKVPDTIPDGQRNATLTRLAGSMRHWGASMNAIVLALWEENSTKCNPPLDWPEIVKIAKSVGTYAPGTLPRTDLGNAERLAGRHGQDLHYVYGMGWHVWNGQAWERDETGQVDRLAIETVRSLYEEASQLQDEDKRKALAKHATASESAAKIGAMINLGRSLPGIPIRAAEKKGKPILDTAPMLLNVTNGTLDLRLDNFGLREHSREDLITKMAGTAYDPNAECPVFKAFLERILPSEALRKFVQRLAGYSLTGDVSEQILPVLHGSGANGKSTLINILLKVIEDYGQTAPRDFLIIKKGAHPTELADLRGARFVSAVEVKEGKKLDEELVKQLTGGDPIKARFMNQDFFQFEPTHTLWYAVNHLPDIGGTDHGIWRRVKLIPFSVKIKDEEKDLHLLDKLYEELPGILNWMVEGCLDWQRHGLGEPEEVTGATRDYRDDSDPLRGFIEDRCELGPDKWTETGKLQEAYRRWAWNANEEHLEWKAVTKRLRERGCEPKSKKVHGKLQRGWNGIGLIGGGDTAFSVNLT